MRVDTDPESARSTDAASMLADTHAEVEKAIAAAEGAARSAAGAPGGVPPAPSVPDVPPATDPGDPTGEAPPSQ